jgi:tektin-1
MANVIQGPNTFTVSEWHDSNHAKLSRAEVQRANAKNLIAQTQQIITERQDQTDRGQRDVEQKLNLRIDSVKFWHSELSRQLNALNDETSQLDAYKRRLENAVAGCTQPLTAANSCLTNRSNRINIDLVHDDVQKELLTEVQVVDGVNAMLQRALEQVIEQIRLNRSAAYHLSADLKDKDTTLNVDNDALSKNNLNILNDKLSEMCLAKQQSNVPRIKTNWTTPGDWQSYSESGILKAEEELQHSLRLRAAVDEILSASNEDLRKQKVSTDNALRQRIEDVTLAKDNLEKERQDINMQIDAICAQITETEKAIKSKNAPKTVAEVRTKSRATSRPAPVELCRDAVQYRLHDELDDIHSSVLELVQQLECLTTQLKALKRAELDLSEDISVKIRSLEIDNSCVVLRNYIIQSY